VLALDDYDFAGGAAATGDAARAGALTTGSLYAARSGNAGGRGRTSRLGVAGADMIAVVPHMRRHRGIPHAQGVGIRRIARRHVTDGRLLDVLGIARPNERVMLHRAVVQLTRGKGSQVSIHGCDAGLVGGIAASRDLTDTQ
jgi:hypothetical protein